MVSTRNVRLTSEIHGRVLPLHLERHLLVGKCRNCKDETFEH